MIGEGRMPERVTLVAAEVRERRAGGAGLRLAWGVADSPFGRCSVGWGARGICCVGFHDGADPRGPDAWPRADWKRDDAGAAERVAAMFGRGALPEVWVAGTDFQIRVWRELARIPEGRVTTYGAVASALGAPSAARAVGAACGANPVAWIIPCHRVVRACGDFSGYHWGDARKRAMLEREGAIAAGGRCRWAERPGDLTARGFARTVPPR
jgi:AraC family transcriptional regulator of adaptative response/methylated-DNA-[protein]-cysteine methyltransferase